MGPVRSQHGIGSSYSPQNRCRSQSPHPPAAGRGERNSWSLALSPKPFPLRSPVPYQSLYLGHSEDCHSEDKGERPCEQVKIGGFARERLVGGAQGFEGGVPGIGKDHKPDDASHQGIVHDDKDDDTGQGLVGAVQTYGVSLGEVILYILYQLSPPDPQTLDF